MLVSFLSGGFPLNIPLHYARSFSYTSHAGFSFIRGFSITHPMLVLFQFMQGISLTHPMLPSFVCREFVWRIPCCLYFYAFFSFFLLFFFFFLTHPKLPSFLCGEFLLHIPCWLVFMRGVSLTHPELTSFLCGEFLLHILCWLYLVWGASSVVYSEDNPLRKELGRSWPRRKVWEGEKCIAEINRITKDRKALEQTRKKN